MVNKVNKDLSIQNELVAKIQLVVKALDDVDDFLDKISSAQSETDKLRCDYIHLCENYDLTDSRIALDIAKKIQETSILRRNWKNANEIRNTYAKYCNRLIGRGNRQMFVSEMKKTLEQLQQDYKERILSDTDKELLLSLKNTTNNIKKETREYIKVSEETRNKVIEELKRGAKPCDLANKYGVKLGTVYSWKKIEV